MDVKIHYEILYKKLTDLQQINHNIFSFYRDLLSKKCNADKKERNLFI